MSFGILGILGFMLIMILFWFRYLLCKFLVFLKYIWLLGKFFLLINLYCWFIFKIFGIVVRLLFRF